MAKAAKWLQKFVRISSRKHDEMSSVCLNNGFRLQKTNRAARRWKQPPKKQFHHASRDKILHDSWSISAALARGFSDRHFERGKALGTRLDITIRSMLYESSAIISVNCFLYLYQYFCKRDNTAIGLLQSFALHSSVPLIAECFFTSVSIATQTRYQNMPVMAVWRRRWRRHILVAVINMVMVSIGAGTYLLTAVQGHFMDKNEDHCKTPFTSGL